MQVCNIVVNLDISRLINMCRFKGTLQFRDANHFGLVDTSNYETLKTRFNKFKTENPERFANLLLKDIVIVHCAQGANRSPPMVAIYADAHKNAAYGTANLNQKIIFLKSGIDAFAIVDTVPHKFCEYLISHFVHELADISKWFRGRGMVQTPNSRKPNRLSRPDQDQ